MANSLDPRLNRIALPGTDEPYAEAGDLDHWQTFEVFLQAARGQQHTHVGIVHAPNAELALVFAKEQFARRGQAVNLWVVRTQDVHATDYDDADMFQPAVDKNYREATFYRTRDKIVAYKQQQGQSVESSGESDDIARHLPGAHKPAPAPAASSASTPDGEGPPKPKPRIIIAPKKK